MRCRSLSRSAQAGTGATQNSAATSRVGHASVRSRNLYLRGVFRIRTVREIFIVKNVNIVKTLFIVAIFPVLASAATHRYIVELTTEPAARFASRNFGAHKESLTRPEVTQHQARIKSEQDGVAAQVQLLGGTVVGRTNIASNVLMVDLPDEKAASLMSIPGVTRFTNKSTPRPCFRYCHSNWRASADCK